MAVYVDDMHTSSMGHYGRMKMCHMIADTSAELLAMADKIRVNRQWIQHPGSPREHFDIAMTKRELAIKHGAIEISMREYAERVTDKENEALRPKVIAALDNLEEHSPEWVKLIRLYIKRLERKAVRLDKSRRTTKPKQSELFDGDSR